MAGMPKRRAKRRRKNPYASGSRVVYFMPGGDHPVEARVVRRGLRGGAPRAGHILVTIPTGRGRTKGGAKIGRHPGPYTIDEKWILRGTRKRFNPGRVDLVEMAHIEQYASGLWFSPGNKKFMGSRWGAFAYSGPGGIFFVSSEKNYDGSMRGYSVREAVKGEKFGRPTYAIKTVGKFLSYETRAYATREAKRLAAGG